MRNTADHTRTKRKGQNWRAPISAFGARPAYRAPPPQADLEGHSRRIELISPRPARSQMRRGITTAASGHAARALFRALCDAEKLRAEVAQLRAILTGGDPPQSPFPLV